jgi:hypothetical protein
MNIDQTLIDQFCKPVVDLRTYTVVPRKLADFVEVFDRYAMPVQLRHLGPPIGFYVSDIGDQNEVTHLWSYDDLADYDRRRIARDNDPDWPLYVQHSVGLIQHQTNRFIKRAEMTSLAGLITMTP